MKMDAEFGKNEREFVGREHHRVVAANEAELSARFAANIIAEDGITVSSHSMDFTISPDEAPLATRSRLTAAFTYLISPYPSVDVITGSFWPG